MQHKRKSKEAVQLKTGTKEAGEQEVETQKHMTEEEKKQQNSRSGKAQKHQCREPENQGNQRSRKGKKQVKQRNREA